MTTPRAIIAITAAGLLAAALIAVWLEFGAQLRVALFVALLALLAMGLTLATLGIRAALRRLATRELAPGASALLLDDGPARYFTPQQPAAAAALQNAPIDVTPVAVVAAPAPHWSQLTRPGALLFGSGDEGAAYAEMQYTGGIALAAKSGYGKTSAMVLLCAQAAAQSATLILCDHHAERPESLIARTAPLHGAAMRLARTPEEIADAIRLAVRIADNRLRSNAASFAPLFLFVDELTGLVMRRLIAPDVLALLTPLTVEPRKVGVHAVFSGHDWSQSALGPTGAILRSAVTTALVLRSDERNAGMFLTTPELRRAAAALPRGAALVVSDETQRVQVPEVSAADLAAVARRLPQRSLPTPQAVRQIAQPPPLAAAAPTERLPEPRQRDLALDALRARPGLTPRELAQHMGWDEQVARNVCGELLDAGAVERRQDGRSYRYWGK